MDRLKNLIGGVLIIFIGTFAVWQASRYQIGSLTSMGPGYFPAAIGGVLLLSGVLIALFAVLAERAPSRNEKTRPDLRRCLCIVLSLVSFVCLGKFAGLFATSFCAVAIAALGDRRNSMRDILLLACALSFVSALVFSYGLNIQFPLFPWSEV